MSERTISSTQNAEVKRLKPLFDSARARREAGLFVAEGRSLCAEAARGRFAVAEIWFTERCESEAHSLADMCGASLTLMSCEVASRLTDQKTPQGIFAVCRAGGGAQVDFANAKRLVGLFDVADPSNAGAVLRTAHALGFDGAVVSGSGADLFSPKSLRAGMGAQFRLPIARMEHKPDALSAAKDAGFRLFAAALTDGAAPLQTVEAVTPAMLVIGNEGAGLDAETVKRCEPVIIPMHSGADSLNASVAAGIFMWHFCARGGGRD